MDGALEMYEERGLMNYGNVNLILGFDGDGADGGYAFCGTRWITSGWLE